MNHPRILVSLLINAVGGAQDRPAPRPSSRLSDVVVTTAGDLYVADAGRHRLVCVAERWGAPRTIATFGPDTPIERPERLALGPPGTVFVSDSASHRVVRVDLETGKCEVVAGCGGPGLDRDGPAAEVALCTPTGIAWDGDRLWICDLGNRALRAVDLDGGTIETVAGGFDATRTEIRNGLFYTPGRFLPADVAVTQDGDVFVLDLASRAVLRLDEATGKLDPIPGTANTRDTGDPRVDFRLAGRREFAVDRQGRFVLAEGPAGRVVRTDAGGTVKTIASELGWPAAVAIGGGDRVFIVDAARGQVYSANDGELTGVYRSETPPPDRNEPAIRTVRRDPDPTVVTVDAVRAAITATGHPWWVRHTPTGIDFVLVPPGTYRRGARTTAEDVRGSARPAHEVRISKPLYVARTELTNGQLRSLDPHYHSVLSTHHDLGEALDGITLDTDAQPAANICWYDGAQFAERWGFRLPTEAEWEYFARAGVDTAYPWGDSLDDAREFANLAGPAVETKIRIEVHALPFDDPHLVTAPVASYRPNAFGLHDVVGNVWEWCRDWYSPTEYERCRDGATDPGGPTDGERKVVRGGSWQMPFRGSATLSFRGDPRPRNHFINSRGVRMVMDPR